MGMCGVTISGGLIGVCKAAIAGPSGYIRIGGMTATPFVGPINFESLSRPVIRGAVIRVMRNGDVIVDGIRKYVDIEAKELQFRASEAIKWETRNEQNREI